jgi:hypothetical protein
MLDILCFFFIYLPILNMIRGRRTLGQSTKAMYSSAIAVAILAYFSQHALFNGKKF